MGREQLLIKRILRLSGALLSEAVNFRALRFFHRSPCHPSYETGCDGWGPVVDSFPPTALKQHIRARHCEIQGQGGKQHVLLVHSNNAIFTEKQFQSF